MFGFRFMVVFLASDQSHNSCLGSAKTFCRELYINQCSERNGPKHRYINYQIRCDKDNPTRFLNENVQGNGGKVYSLSTFWSQKWPTLHIRP